MSRFRYSIRTNDNTYYKVVNNQVTTQTTPYYFDEGVANFNEQGIKYRRNIESSGFTTTYMDNDYVFKQDLMKILKHIFFRYGIDATAIFRVERMTNYQFKTYTLDYESQVDFQDCSANSDEFLAGLMEGGISEKLKSRMGVSFDIGSRDIGWMEIMVPPQMVRARCRFISVTPKSQAPVVPNRPALKYSFPGFSHVDEVITEVLESPNYRPIDYNNVLANSLTMVPIPDFPMEYGQPYQQEDSTAFEAQGIQKIINGTQRVVDFLLQTNVTIYDVQVRGQLNVYIKNSHSTSAVTFAMKLYSMPSSGGSTVEIPNSNPTVTIPAASDVIHTFNIDIFASSIGANNVLYLSLVNLTPTIEEVEWMNEGKMPLVIDFKHFTTPFNVKAKNWRVAGDQVIKMATDEGAMIQSDLLTQDVSYKDGLDCKPAHLAILSSDCIKFAEKPKILVSWAEYMKATDVMLCAGWGVEGTKVRVEKRSYFYQLRNGGLANQIADMGEPEQWPMILPAQELLYNTMSIGYKEVDIDDLNGPEEYNTTLKVMTNSTRVITDKELISPVSASGMAIYRKFIKYATGKDTDKGSDNELFVLQYYPTPVSSGVYRALVPNDIKANPTITSLTNKANAVNMGLTPKRCLLRRAYYELGHFFDSNPATNIYKLRFVSLDKNQELTSQLNGELIVEKADVDLAAEAVKYGPGRLFYPYILDVKHAGIENFRSKWDAHKYGYLVTHINGVELGGFPIEAAEKNLQPKITRLSLLLTADYSPVNLK